MVGWIILAVLGLILVWLILIYNGLVTLRNDVQSSWKQIDVQLKRRHDLPNLDATVKGARARCRSCPAPSAKMT